MSSQLRAELAAEGAMATRAAHELAAAQAAQADADRRFRLLEQEKSKVAESMIALSATVHLNHVAIRAPPGCITFGCIPVSFRVL